MAHDTGFWTWPIDVAAEQTRSGVLIAGVFVLYALGAIALIAQARLGLPMVWASAGVGLVILALVGSAGIVAKVMLARSRLSFH